MQYQIKILLLSFVITIITSLAIIPILKKLKVSQMERTEGPQSHLGKQGTPTMGGIIMILVITVLTGFLCYDYIKDNQSSVAKNLIPIAAVSIGFGLVGFIDYFKKLVLKNTEGLKPLYKMIGLLIFSVAFVLYITKVLNIGTETYIPFIKTYFTLPVWLYIPFAILVLLGTSNAVNLTDGIDGLATSVTALILTCLTVIGIIFNIKEIVVFGSITIGTCLGFLLFNLNPAKIFMGDTGSLMLGGAVAGMALYLKMPLLLLIIALVPVIETLSVMIQVRYFKKTGNRIFKMTPIHHHFELSGWNENKIVSIFSIITLMLSVVGLLAI